MSMTNLAVLSKPLTCADFGLTPQQIMKFVTGINRQPAPYSMIYSKTGRKRSPNGTRKPNNKQTP